MTTALATRSSAELAAPPRLTIRGAEQLTADQLQRRRAEARTNAAAFRQHIARYRVDHHWLPDGRVEAVLTVTLPDGHEFRFTGHGDPKEVAQAMIALNPQVGGFLGNIWKGVKKVAKKVATSKVFKVASTALGAIAPVLGPLAPAALAAGASMKAATALTAARAHSAKGNKDAAAKLVSYAGKAAKVASAANAKVKPAPKPAAARPAARPVSPVMRAAAPAMRATAAARSMALRKLPAAAAAKPAPATDSPSLERATLDHAQASSAKLYTMFLRPA